MIIIKRPKYKELQEKIANEFIKSNLMKDENDTDKEKARMQVISIKSTEEIDFNSSETKIELISPLEQQNYKGLAYAIIVFEEMPENEMYYECLKQIMQQAFILKGGEIECRI